MTRKKRKKKRRRRRRKSLHQLQSRRRSQHLNRLLLRQPLKLSYQP
jgi:hypothetical protein